MATHLFLVTLVALEIELDLSISQYPSNIVYPFIGRLTQQLYGLPLSMQALITPVTRSIWR